MIKSINYVILQIQVAIEKSWNCQTPDIWIFTIDDDDDYKIKQTNNKQVLTCEIHYYLDSMCFIYTIDYKTKKI